eukprot:GHVL01031671.1.p1 GENE.GHVL01031671.1~~GHVL01031671.1.p1  ORF type:complete len:290 (+),score=75.50 GHVL01031671.1:24-893(+)
MTSNTLNEANIDVKESENTEEGNDDASEWKKKGNEYFLKGKMDTSISMYTRGICIKNIDKKLLSVLFSNRAACYIGKEMYVEAIDDCKRAIAANESNIKAWCRAAKASMMLELYKQAAQFAYMGLQQQKDDMSCDEILKDFLEESKNKLKKLIKSRTNNYSDDDVSEALSRGDVTINELHEAKLNMIHLNDQGNQLMTQLESANKQSRLSQLALVEMDNDKNLSVYQSVGRIFVEQKMADLRRILKESSENSEIAIPKLEENLQKIQQKQKEVQKSYEELVLPKRTAVS